MLAIAIITVPSFVLVALWLRGGFWSRFPATTDDRSSSVAEANDLHFLDVREQLRQPGAAGDLDSAIHVLDEDYRTLCLLLDHSVGSAGWSAIEQWTLRAYFRVTRAWFRFCHRLGMTRSAREALLELSLIAACLANVMGERIEVRAS